MSAHGFRKAGHTPSLIAALVHFDVSFMVWVLLGALGAYVASDLGLSPVQKGLMVAVPPLGGAVFQLVGHRLPERVGAMTGLVGAAGGVGGFLLALGLGALASATGTFATGFALFANVAGLMALAVAGRDRVWAGATPARRLTGAAWHHP